MKKAFVILATTLSMSGAFAQTAASAAAPASSAAVHREARVEERIAYLHSALKITPQQDTQWNAFADVMRSNGETLAQLYQQRAADESTLSALDDMKQYAQITQAHADGMQKLVAAFEPLYDSFSPEQKKLADTTFHRGAEHAAERRRGRGHAKAEAASESTAQ
ncbi:hypothetical protein CY652_03145 [Burkholderia sp. WAC0059]|uniref:Spy/CpxP family protein refolding chaperone n=1 Tax=Burkholderia sp. WAC0059 TaxID=2066022 RepID=UPI000C7F38C6|nr:Spy/CpxP family protein refolding chaperone [Burkholderia sp. WAC0059]PLZ03980.1 hypothetical protein CY652_03145 [Burkholderia sp. WAC0059]